MSSAICRNFVQNAWKKELCSNCFKSKDEHVEISKPKPISLTPKKNVASIIKKGSRIKPKQSVCFTSELTEIIGIGGEDWDSEEEQTDEEDSSSEDFVAESDDDETEKELKRITKENTDFNTTSLKENIEMKKSCGQLMLGKPVVDAAGRKQTLMVSITPFGEDSSCNRFSKPTTVITTAKKITNGVQPVKNLEQKIEPEEKSLLDEITETLENCKNPIQIVSRKKCQQDVTLEVDNDANKENEDVKKNKIENGDRLETKLAAIQVPEKKVALTRTPALKRDQEKPVVYQTSTAKIELLNTKKFKHNRITVSKPETASTNESKENGNKHNSQASQERLGQVTEHSKYVTQDTTNNTNNITESETVENVINLEFLPKTVNSICPQSREQAGEPDGRADEDPLTEPPALPLTPPPMLEVQNSFLHNKTPIYEKPKVPSKPVTMLIRKPIGSNQIEVKNHMLTTFSGDIKTSTGDTKEKLVKQDSNSSDIVSKAINKRKAPLPPETNVEYARVAQYNDQLSPPVLREIEKRERASSCSPKLREIDSSLAVPRPAPRKSLSMSTDNLDNCGDEKRKEKTKGRFSLKKFLRMSSSKDLSKISGGSTKNNDDIDSSTLPKPRLVIVHPLELNGTGVEVVAKQNSDLYEYPNVNLTKFSEYENYEPFTIKSHKPPPPPRNLDNYGYNCGPKPNLAQHPKSLQVLNKQKELGESRISSKKSETIYANIGEVRSAIIPNKPQRTASMREREAQQQKELNRNCVGDNGDSNENVYDYINNGRSSSPDSDSSPSKNTPTSKSLSLSKRSESSIDVSSEYFKYSHIPRSVSLTYCGSETESEIYAPYSFYGSESEVAEDDHEWIQNGRTHKLRSRKGRSIVHKNLEDNYGAVIAANHEALAQVLENIQQINHVQPALRGLKLLPNLRWTHFTVTSSSAPTIAGCRIFHEALWGTQHVTLAINVGPVPSSTLSLGTVNLVPITEFSDLIPRKYVHLKESDDQDAQIQATVAIFPWLEVNTLQSYSELLKTKGTQAGDETSKDVIFIMLQLVNALKILQSQGIEELSLSLNSFVLCKEIDKDVHQKLYVLQGLGEEINSNTEAENYGTLCMCAWKALTLLQPTAKITHLLQSLLNNERAVTLTQVKSVLEFCLWGPSDVALGSTIHERELALQRWLDLQRATVLHGLVCTRIQLTVYEECHLFFLVRSNSRMMCDASLLLESSNMKHILTRRHK